MRAAAARRRMEDARLRHHGWIRTHGTDLSEVADWFRASRPMPTGPGRRRPFGWAFLDKTFGFGCATQSGKGWFDGGSPTKGFLSGVTVGPMESTFHDRE